MSRKGGSESGDMMAEGKASGISLENTAEGMRKNSYMLEWRDARRREAAEAEEKKSEMGRKKSLCNLTEKRYLSVQKM